MVSRESVRTRLALGWEPEDAITRAKHDKPALEFTHNGRTLSLRGWAEQTGIKYHTLYRRITKAHMPFADALALGPDGPQLRLPVTAFGETKPMYMWGVDARANCVTTTLRRRLLAGWEPEQAITSEPDNRNTLGTGAPVSAFGDRMGLEDWARRTHIPAPVLRQRMDNHDLTLEQTLRSFGWTPLPTHQDTTKADLLEVSADELRTGDTIAAVIADTHSNRPRFTVRRINLPTADRAADSDR
ncbi:hypothetical protein [Nocardia cerradoensis]|uniref:hypothetical protein n=1 Tax=Nocardia cerradoensis TaxID=85688 RepID=UPI000B8AD543|nr:hypothetical protein [Nocardia cerradoensis]